MQTAVSAPQPIATSRTATPRLSDGLRLMALVGSLTLLGFLGDGFRSQVRTESERGRAQESGTWEARRMLAQIYWLKTHAVMHAGAEERAARPGEEESRKGEFHSHGGAGKPEKPATHDANHEGHESCPAGAHGESDGGSVLVIPPAREDFRGVLGDLERAVKPYAAKDGQLYAKDVDQTLPYYQLVTWVDPHHVEAYSVGATMICRAGRFPDQAITFLHDGERNNPYSFEIQTELGRFYLVYKKDFPTAERHLLAALKLIPKVAKLTEVQRGERDDAYRWLALTYREWGKPQQARTVAARGIGIIGEDISLRAILNDARPGKIELHPRKMPS